MRTPAWLAALVLALPVPSRAETGLQKKLLFQIRESFGLPAGVSLAVGEFTPSGLAGLRKAVVTMVQGEQKSERTVYVSQDGKHWFMADVNAMSEDVDKARAAKISLEGPVRGKKGAPIVVVEFSDLQCPYCKKAHLGLKQELLGGYAGKVEWHFKHFPLVNIHPWAERAAVSAECARRQGSDKFWQMVDLFYDGQEAIDASNFREKAQALASRAGLDVKAFTFCLDNMETLPAVRKQAEEGEKADVNSTPSFFINGHAVRGYKDFAPFKQLIDEMLAGKHKPEPS